MKLTQDDHARVTAAVIAAERGTDGEIVTIVADASDSYHDVVLHWATLLMFLVMAVVAIRPGILLWLHALLSGGWEHEASHGALVSLLLLLMAVKFLAARLILGWAPFRMALTPRATKARRVRRRAIDYFKAATERRTAARTGVLLYLSLAEHRAEIVADEALHALVAPETWGQAMAGMVDAIRAGRPGEGMAQAVEAIGAVLAAHFPKTDTDRNELPDRLIEL